MAFNLKSLFGHGEDENKDRRSKERVKLPDTATILIVDDSRTAIAVLSKVLEPTGYSIISGANGEEGIENHDLKPNDVDEYLLFPPIESDETDSNSIADKWISSGGNHEISIGELEIQHLVFQLDYYNSNIVKLKSENPKRFILYHMPRIIFAIALRRVIDKSKYAHLLK